VPVGTEHPWQIINEKLLSHCDAQGFHLQKKEGDNGETFNSLSWDLLTQGQVRNGLAHYKTDQVFMLQFDVAYLQKMAVVDPETAQSKSLLILCNELDLLTLFSIDHDLDPLKGHIYKGTHPCFAWRMFVDTKIVLLELPIGQARGTCLTGICPTDAPPADTNDVTGSVRIVLSCTCCC
jgi:hypothetical protein